MYIHQGAHKTYTKWILIPLWISHLLLLLPVAGVVGYAMLEIAGWEPTHDKPVPADLAAFLTLLIVALLLEPLEMVFQSYRILEPWIYLNSQVYKALVGTVIASIATYSVAVTRVTAIFIWALVLLWALALSYHASLIYAAVVMHKHLHGSKYDIVEDPVRRDDESH